MVNYGSLIFRFGLRTAFPFLTIPLSVISFGPPGQKRQIVQVKYGIKVAAMHPREKCRPEERALFVNCDHICHAFGTSYRGINNIDTFSQRVHIYSSSVQYRHVNAFTSTRIALFLLSLPRSVDTDVFCGSQFKKAGEGGSKKYTRAAGRRLH